MATKLPRRNYYRAHKLGNGAYGSVVCAYDDDGGEWAVKTFWEEEAEGDEGWEDDDGEWHDESSPSGIDCGILREIVMLRLLNGAHPNLMRLTDISEMDGCLALVMPMAAGSLAGAIEKGTLNNKDKLRVAAKALHALAFLHSHGIIHRDLKPDNLLLDTAGDPIIADFSLAKVVGGEGIAAALTDDEAGRGRRKRRRAEKKEDSDAAPALTASMGTPTYTAPEIVNGEDYGVKADVFSMGVVRKPSACPHSPALARTHSHSYSFAFTPLHSPELVHTRPHSSALDCLHGLARPRARPIAAAHLGPQHRRVPARAAQVLYELFNGSGLDAWKNKHALAQVEEIRSKLGDKPIPRLLKAMLAFDPEERVSAQEVGPAARIETDDPPPMMSPPDDDNDVLCVRASPPMWLSGADEPSGPRLAGARHATPPRQGLHSANRRGHPPPAKRLPR